MGNITTHTDAKSLSTSWDDLMYVLAHMGMNPPEPKINHMWMDPNFWGQLFSNLENMPNNENYVQYITES